MEKAKSTRKVTSVGLACVCLFAAMLAAACDSGSDGVDPSTRNAAIFGNGGWTGDAQDGDDAGAGDIDEGGNASDASGEGNSSSEVEGCCFVTGIGHIGDASDHPGAGRADQDSFGGNAKGMKDGTVQGEWQNTTHLGDLFHGQATWLRCWNDGGPGPEVPRADDNIAMWGGPGKWNHQEGYSFVIYAEDRAEGGHHQDYYSIYVLDSTGVVIYSEGDLIDGGNFQIHPSNNGHPCGTGDIPFDLSPFVRQ